MKTNSLTRQLDIFCKIISHILTVKSPHTGHHIQRVSILAEMITQALNKEKKGYFSPNDLYKISVAAKLHDSGKTTTPDYLLEKSTKLECLHNRIHEIRCRFEILRRDAEIACLKKIMAAPEKTAQIKADFRKKVKQLEKDFAFIADCNIGNSEIKSSDLHQLKKISHYKFKRYFNRLLGLSWLEKQQLTKQQISQYQRSATEFLLQDNPQDNYKEIPTGEIYNLSTIKGTINKQERQKIEQHAAETAAILNLLELPPEYACLNNYASEHHERPNGSGYPLGLSGAELSVPSRIIMIADIFEALTSSDRPYKSPKKLSEALRILQTMKNKGQIDAEIYTVFIKNKIFLKYAQRYLSPEQIDEITLKDYL